MRTMKHLDSIALYTYVTLNDAETQPWTWKCPFCLLSERSVHPHLLRLTAAGCQQNRACPPALLDWHQPALDRHCCSRRCPGLRLDVNHSAST